MSRVGRVLLVTSELRCGGAERVMVHLASTLRTLGIAAEILCLQRPGSLAQEAIAAGVDVSALQSLRSYDVKAVCLLAKHLRRFRPDVINVHDRASLPYVVLANWIGGRRPVVFSAHGLLVQDERPRRRDRWAARRLSQITAVSQPAAEEYARLLGWKGKIERIDNGIPPVERSEELRRRLRRSLELPDNGFVFAAVGNVKPEKGFEDLLEAAAALRGMAAGQEFAVLIAGGSADEKYHASLLARSKELNLGDGVRFLGHCSDTRSLYSAADAFVLSSRKEGLPMVLLEAMSAGLPVVATEVGAVPEVVRRDVDGLLVPPASANQLARAMSRLATDESLRVSLGGAARARAESRYGVQRMAKHYLDVYSLAAARPTRGASSPSISPCKRVGVTASEGEDVSPAGPVQTHPSPSAPLVKGEGTVQKRLTVLMLGPLPPLTGGMATVIDSLLKSRLNESVELSALNTGKTTRPDRTLVEGVLAQITLLGRLIGVLRRRRIRILHLHTCEFLGFWRDCAHALVAALMGCRIVWHMHGARFDQWAARQGPCRRAVIKVAFERAAAVIVLSDEWRRRLSPYAPRARWFVVPNGIPMPQEPAALPLGVPRFLFLGDWTLRKGVADLVAATDVAVKDHGFSGAVALAGFEKEPGQRKRLDRLIEESGCSSQIEVVGLLTGKAKEDALAAAHCLVLPSYGEGLPMALLEAMCRGRPVIATRVGAIPELVTDGREGFLIEPGDVEALADRLARVASDSDLVLRQGTAARQRVEKEYSSDVMASHIASLYTSLN